VYDVSKNGIALYSGVPLAKDLPLAMRLTFEDPNRRQVSQAWKERSSAACIGAPTNLLWGSNFITK
jgi:hypothetical protein